MAPEVLVPSSAAEAVELFGDGADGDRHRRRDRRHARHRLRPRQPRAGDPALAGRDGRHLVDGDTVTIGATTSVNALLDLEERVPALAACARNLADCEIRGQATVGGNLCLETGFEAPRGDLQGALLALDARVRSAGPGRRANRAARGVPRRATRTPRPRHQPSSVPAASAFSVLEYPHTHEYTVLAVTGVRTNDGTIRLAATGLAGRGARLRSAEAAASDPAAAGRPPSATSLSPTMRSPRPGIASRPCRCSSAASSPNSRSPHEPHGQRGRHHDSRAAL